MNIKNRVSAIESKMSFNSEFCRCGTLYYDLIEPGEQITTVEVCPDCRRKVKPQTFAEFVRAAHFETNLILPRIEES